MTRFSIISIIAYIFECPGAAMSQHLDKTNQSNCSTVNQNSDYVKTFRDKNTDYKTNH